MTCARFTQTFGDFFSAFFTVLDEIRLDDSIFLHQSLITKPENTRRLKYMYDIGHTQSYMYVYK